MSVRFAINLFLDNGNTYGNRLAYLRRYRESPPEKRVELLNHAMMSVVKK